MNLKTRQRPIPGGFVFHDAVLSWSAPKWASFEVICQGVRTARLSNPALTKAYKLSTDPAVIAQEVDLYNAQAAWAAGNTDFVTGATGGAPAGVPFYPSQKNYPDQSRNALAGLAEGAETLIRWISDGAEAVPIEQANARSKVCSECPLNKKGDWTRFFSVPVASGIRRALQIRGDLKLETDDDDKLGVCQSCRCVLKLKVHLPLKNIVNNMENEDAAKLPKNCWINMEGQNEAR